MALPDRKLERVAADTIAVRVMGPVKAVVAGAPSYFTRRSRPRCANSST
jgi:hypothetical protein